MIFTVCILDVQSKCMTAGNKSLNVVFATNNIYGNDHFKSKYFDKSSSTIDGANGRKDSLNLIFLLILFQFSLFNGFHNILLFHKALGQNSVLH